MYAGSYYSAGGVDQKKASWYMLLFVQEGTAERLLQAHDWRLFKAITSPGVTDDAHQAYITDLSRPGRLTAGCDPLLSFWCDVCRRAQHALCAVTADPCTRQSGRGFDVRQGVVKLPLSACIPVTAHREGSFRCRLSWYRANVDIDGFTALEPNNDIPGVQMTTMGIWPTGDIYCLEVQMLASESKVPKGCWRYERLDSPSHWAPRDKPEEVAALLLDFFKQEFPHNKL